MSDPKMSTEDAIVATDKLLESIAHTLEKFIGRNVGDSSAATPLPSSGMYSRYAGSANNAQKQEQYANNLVLINGAQADVAQIMEQSAKSSLTIRKG